MTEERLNHTVKRLEWWQLLRSAVPLIAAGLGGAVLYAFLAGGEDGLDAFWVGPPFMLAGSACAVIGYRGRLREISSPAESTARHYPWLFIGWALVVAGLMIPPYALS